ncbi:unnamed protein product [Ilex paraguariensis]|uniref:Uncharacterized protein n=1 Tax=Ilex paraguariensis TaxID=185542 RepID=A0ABC8QML8_9AQUA
MSEEKKFDNKKQTMKDEAMPTFFNVNKKKENGKGKEVPKNGKETSRNPSLKERKEVKYTFKDDDVEEIFNSLLKAKAIKLPEPMQLYEVNKTDDLKFCQYHWILSHSLQDFYVLKNSIQAMVNKGYIEIQESSTATISKNIFLVENEPIPTVMLPKGAIRVAFVVNGEVTYRDEWQTHVSKRTNTLSPSLKSSGRPGIMFQGKKVHKKNKKMNKKTQKKTQVHLEDEYVQPKRVPITLEEYLPTEFFKEENVEE